MNNISLSGRLTADPEQKTTQNGISVCSFTLAVKRPHVKDVTDFINCTAWRQSAEYLCKYGRKGDLVELAGSLQSRNYEDKSGNKRTAFDVVADFLSLIGSKAKNDTSENENGKFDTFLGDLQARGVNVTGITTNDDLPF